jgi:hypothetical protein
MSNIRTKGVIPMIIEAEDLTTEEMAAFDAAKRGEQHLGVGDVTSEVGATVANKVLTIMVRKIEKLVPSGYVLDEIEVSFSAEGSLFASIGVSGEAKVVLKRT